MSSLVQTRKLKRWVVLTRPHIVSLSNTSNLALDTGNNASVLILVDSTSVTPSAIKIGDPSVTLLDTTITYTYGGYSNNHSPLPVLVAGDMVTLEPGTTNQETIIVKSFINRILTPVSAFKFAHPASMYLSGGYHDKLTTSASSGDDSIGVSFPSYCSSGSVVCIGYGLPTAELVDTDAVSSNKIQINQMLYYDHVIGERVEKVKPGTTVTSGGSSRFIYDTVLVANGTTGTGTLVVSGVKRLPWIQELETLSFSEAKEKAKDMAYIIGLENVRVCRIADLDSIITPIS